MASLKKDSSTSKKVPIARQSKYTDSLCLRFLTYPSKALKMSKFSPQKRLLRTAMTDCLKSFFRKGYHARIIKVELFLLLIGVVLLGFFLFTGILLSSAKELFIR